MSDEFDPVEFVRQKRTPDEAWRFLSNTPEYRAMIRSPEMVMLCGVQAEHLRGFDLTRRLCALD